MFRTELALPSSDRSTPALAVRADLAPSTAAVLDSDEELRGELRVEAGRRQRDQLFAFAAPFMPRTWAIEAASGWGALLARAIVDAITATGRAWLSLVTPDGRPAIRACITSYRTDEVTITSLRQLLVDARRSRLQVP